VSWLSGPVTVRVPATSANLGPGFDSFGLALSLHDLVTAQVTGGGLAIDVIGAGAQTADAGEQHLVVRAMRAAFARIAGADVADGADGADSPGQPPGLALSCRNAIPQGYGLGSSAGAIVAGLLAGRALAGDAGRAALPDDEVFRLAADLEGHPDNVAACLAGGLTIAWDPAAGDGTAARPAGDLAARPAGAAGSRPRVARLSPLPDIAAVLCIPADGLPTVTARQVLPPEIPHAAAAANSARAALLVTALTRDPGLLLDGTEDFLHQRYRAAVMPATASLLGRLRAAGVPAVVSGAGPSVLAFTAGAAGPAAGDVAAIADSGDVPWRVLPLDVDTAGAIVQPG
jgi:homoserine kinase